jgi:predicted amidophosphoribosyltransferase
LIGLSIFLVILLIVAVFARKSQKNAQIKDKGTAQATTTAAKTRTTAEITAITEKCIGCGAELRANASFCTSCGKKKEGRRLGAASKTTPAKSKICSYCGSQLTSTNAKFCRTCGTGIEQ